MVIIKAISVESFLGFFYVFEAKPLNPLSIQGAMKSFYFADGGRATHSGGDMANALLFSAKGGSACGRQIGGILFSWERSSR